MEDKDSVPKRTESKPGVLQKIGESLKRIPDRLKSRDSLEKELASTLSEIGDRIHNTLPDREAIFISTVLEQSTSKKGKQKPATPIQVDFERKNGENIVRVHSDEIDLRTKEDNKYTRLCCMNSVLLH